MQLFKVKPGSDEFTYLTSISSDASYNEAVPKHVIIKQCSTQSALLEEFLHERQFKIGMLEKYGSREYLEVHVKDFMLRHARMLGIDNPHDIKLLQQLKIEEMERLNYLQHRKKI